MAIVASWSGAGLTDGTAVGTSTAGTADTAFTTVTADAAVVDDTGLHAPRIQIDQDTATAAELIWDSTVVGTTLTAWAVRLYVELSGWPPSNGGRILSAYTAANVLLWFIDLTSAGLLRLRDSGGSAVDTSALALPEDSELRIEAVHDDGDVTVTVYAGNGTTVYTSVSATGLGTSSTLQTLRFGMPSTSPVWPTFWLDEMALAGAAAEIGPPEEEEEEETTPTSRWPLRDRYELLLDGTWTDITGYVLERNPVTITRGRSAEAQSADPCKMSLTLNDRDGRFSPRNPVGDYHGLIGRNTQVRASLPAQWAYAQLRATGTASRVSCPTATALNVTDLDVRLDLDAATWGGGNLCAKYAYPSDGSWFVDMDGARYVYLIWTPDGTDANRLQAASTVPLPKGKGRRALRITLDVDNGASGYTATFYTADTIDGTWTQLGDEVTGTATTSIFASSADVEIGDISTISGSAPDGRVYAFELRDGVAGTLVASPDFTAQTAGDTTFDDDQSNTWTVGAGAGLDDREYRFHGEVPSWPQTWAMDGVDRYVQITAAGISRRLSQNAPALRSTMFRAHTNPALTSVRAYWPCEDGAEATSLASGRAGGAPMRITGSPTLADYDGWTASGPMPTMGTGRFSGTVRPYTATGSVFVYAFVFVDEPPTAETSLLKILTTGSARAWEIRLLANGNLRTLAWNRTGTLLTDSSDHGLGDEILFNLDARGFLMLKLQLVEDGSDIDWETSIIDFDNRESIGDTIFTTGWSDTVLTGQTVGRVSQVVISDQGTLGGTKISHIVVSDDVDRWLGSVVNAIRAQNGETPIARMTRLCKEEELSFTALVDNEALSPVTMGDQLSKPLIDLLAEGAGSDAGILYEPRDLLGYAYRSRRTLYNQAPLITLDYSAAQITGDLVPVDDDKQTQNDVTVKRAAGSSVRVEQTTGPLSTAEPDDGGVGRYDTQVTLSLETDEQLPDQASWRLHLGTVDEARYPKLAVNMRSRGIRTSDTMYDELLAVDVGDRIDLTGIPEGLPPDDVGLLVQGYTETLRLNEHSIVFNVLPESPYRIAVTDAGDRLGTAGSELAAAAGEPTQLATNPSVETDTTGWFASGATLARATDRAHAGDASAKVTPDGTTATPVVGVTASTAPAVTVGDAYQARAWVYSPGGHDAVNARIQWLDSSGDQVDTTVSGDIAVPAGAWTLVTMAGIAPTGTATASPQVLLPGTPATGDVLYVDELELLSAALLSVETTEGPIWTTDTDDLPFDVMVAGERVRVHAIAGETSPQSFTVSRSINGIAKAQTTGAPVTLADRSYIGL